MPRQGRVVEIPRPRRFHELYRPADIRRLYEQGESARAIALAVGVSRWVIDARTFEFSRIDASPLQRREREDALALRRHLDSVREDRDRAQHCQYPGCSDWCGKGALCDACWRKIAVSLGRRCSWPNCQQDAHRPEHTICSYHLKRAEGLL